MSFIETEFKESFSSGLKLGFTLTQVPFVRNPLSPWSVMTRKYDDDNLCVFIFEDESSAIKEKTIFPLQVQGRLAVQNISIQEIQSYVDLMHKVCPQPILIILRSIKGEFGVIR